jgi:hypothetical protein
VVVDDSETVPIDDVREGVIDPLRLNDNDDVTDVETVRLPLLEVDGERVGLAVSSVEKLVVSDVDSVTVADAVVVIDRAWLCVVEPESVQDADGEPLEVASGVGDADIVADEDADDDMDCDVVSVTDSIADTERDAEVLNECDGVSVRE